MNTKLGSSEQEPSIRAVSSAGIAASSSTVPLHLHLQRQNYWHKGQTVIVPQSVLATTVYHDSLEEEDSSLSDSLNCDVKKSATKRQQGFISEFSDSLEDSGDDTDDTTIDSDTGSFYSVDSRLTPVGYQSEASLQETEYFSESTLYNSAHSLNNSQSSSLSSFLSVNSYDTLNKPFPYSANKRKDFSNKTSSDHQQESDISSDFTSCPDLSPKGILEDKEQFASPRFSSIQAYQPISKAYNSIEKSHLKTKTISSSSMSAMEGNVSPRVGELQAKKKKGLMSSFRKGRKTSRKLRQQKMEAGEGDSISTGTGVTSDGEQDFAFDSEASAPNSPSPVKSQNIAQEINSITNAIDQLESNLENQHVPHERLNGTASSETNSIEGSPSIVQKSGLKEEKKIGRNKFGGSLFRKKKVEQVTPSTPTDANGDTESLEPKEEDKDEPKVETETPNPDDIETPTLNDAEPEQNLEITTPTEEAKVTESKPTSFRSYISNVQFVKNWTAGSQGLKGQQTTSALAKTGLDGEAVDGEKAGIDSTDAAPGGTETTTIETKVLTSSANGKPSNTEAGASTDKREHLYKILVIGELGTGKTSIIKRYVHQFFSQHYRATIGVDFALKVLNWDNNTVIRLQLWDIAGQERFGNMTRVYYKEAVGAFVVFDVTRAQTFDAVTKWKTDLDTKVTLADGSPIPTVLLANKCDQPKEGVVNNPARMDDYCRERGFSGWFETSAKENINIDDASRFLVNKILLNEKQGMMMTESLDTEKFSVDGKANPADKSGCRC